MPAGMGIWRAGGGDQPGHGADGIWMERQCPCPGPETCHLGTLRIHVSANTTKPEVVGRGGLSGVGVEAAWEWNSWEELLGSEDSLHPTGQPGSQDPSSAPYLRIEGRKTEHRGLLAQCLGKQQRPPVPLRDHTPSPMLTNPRCL